MAALKEHLVLRCPSCERPIWIKTLMHLMGPKGRHPELGFIAKTGGPGAGRGWKGGGVITTPKQLEAHAGATLFNLFRSLAKQTVERLYYSGLLDQAVLHTLLQTTTIEVTPRTEPRPIDTAPWRPQVGGLTVPPRQAAAIDTAPWTLQAVGMAAPPSQTASPFGRASTPPIGPSPPARPPRPIDTEEWKPRKS